MHGKVKIKICGITTPTEIAYINELCPDYIGFVFAKSRRQVTVEEAMALRQKLKKGIKVVGVFVNEESSKVNEIISKCQLDVIQLHGDENTAAYEVPIPIWKCVSIKGLESVQQIVKNEEVDSWVIDTYTEEARGGSGKKFEWEYVTGLSASHSIVLAGGLNASNVREAIGTVSPDVVDVSSGVEEDGKKSYKKLKKFIEEVRRDEFKV